MPAAELSKLYDQLFALSALLERPNEFRRALVALCEQYADLSFRPGQSAAGGQVLLPTYRLPHLVLRQLELEMGANARKSPEQALVVCDALWAESYYEPRYLAAVMLGQIPLSQAEGILERIKRWAVLNQDRQLLEILLHRATSRLRSEGSDVLLELYADWLSSPDTAVRRVGLKALHALAADPSFENLPPIFNLLTPLVRAAPQPFFNDLGAILITLAERTPTETLYFLRQVLASPTSKDTPRLTRRILPALSETQQDSLRAALKNREGNAE